MKKTLRLFMLSLMAIAFGNTYAQTEVTIDFDNDYQTLFPTVEGVSSSDSSDGDFTENTTSTPVNGVTVTVSATTAGTAKNRIWYTNPRLRMYNGTFTVTSETEKITKIEFTGHNTNFNLSTTTGTLSGKTWVGEAQSIIFGVTKNTQIDKIVVTIGGEPGTIEPEPEPETKSVTVAEALTIIEALEDGKTTSDVYQVKGFVINITEISTQYGNVTFVMADDAAAETGLTVFRAKGFNGEKITDENLLKKGDEVVVEGKLQKYVKNGETTPEVATGGKIISINGQTEAGISTITADGQQQAVYTLAGQRVQNAQKGLYIIGGKKVVK